jgi:hypothetical protein
MEKMLGSLVEELSSILEFALQTPNKSNALVRGNKGVHTPAIPTIEREV